MKRSLKVIQTGTIRKLGCVIPTVRLRRVLLPHPGNHVVEILEMKHNDRRRGITSGKSHLLFPQTSGCGCSGGRARVADVTANVTAVCRSATEVADAVEPEVVSLEHVAVVRGAERRSWRGRSLICRGRRELSLNGSGRRRTGTWLSSMDHEVPRSTGRPRDGRLPLVCLLLLLQLLVKKKLPDALADQIAKVSDWTHSMHREARRDVSFCALFTVKNLLTLIVNNY